MKDYYICTRCGDKTTVRDPKTGYCPNCCAEVDIVTLGDKIKPEVLGFEINSIQKMTSQHKGEDYIRYMIEVPKALNYQVESMGRKQKWRIRAIPLGR